MAARHEPEDHHFYKQVPVLEHRRKEMEHWRLYGMFSPG